MIPNNVELHDDKKVLRALSSWQPRFLDWWKEWGPHWAQDAEVYLRTAVDVSDKGWAKFDYVKMPEYRWGIFLTPEPPDQRQTFGLHKGSPVWTQVPGEYRSALRKLIVTQGDTEPASVEQLQWLGKTAPSLYDLRQLFQVNVEEGRHLWAMVYLLHKYFGAEGREEASLMLERHSGSDQPRLLEAFNNPTPDWLSFFCFSYFTDRDGKFQLAAMAESGFSPLARTCKFMLIEEANHMFTGESGIRRVIKRTCQKMREREDVSEIGGIPLSLIQRYINYHYAASLDLFGNERSTNAAELYQSGLKGRYLESTLDPLDPERLQSLNEILQDQYIEDCQTGIWRWNRELEKNNVSFRFRLPSKTLNRKIGKYAGVAVSDLPTEQDREYVKSLMVPSFSPDTYSDWIAPPDRGVDLKPVNFEYVKF